MGLRVLFIIAALIGLMFFASWLRTATPAQRSAALRNIIIYGLALAVLIMVATGRAHWLFALVAAATPWIQRGLMAMRAWNSFKATRGPASGQQSSVNTAWLNVSLDHDSGEIDGEILAGPFKGSRLSNLEMEQLLNLRDACLQGDPQSVPLVEAYIDQVYGPDWRGENEQTDTNQAETVSGPMSEAEACAILGLEPGAGKREIRDAHRRLMQKMHPDRGGSPFLAARINQARDLLLGK